MTAEEWGELAHQLWTLYGRAVPDGWASANYGLVADLEAVVVLRAAHQHVTGPKGAYPPHGGELAALAGRLLGRTPPDFDQVYQEVQRAVRRHGAWADPTAIGLSTPALALVQAYGWQDWCAAESMDNLRAQARRMYDAQAGRATVAVHRERLRAGAPRHVAELLPEPYGDACPLCGQLETAGRLCAECAAHGVGA